MREFASLLHNQQLPGESFLVIDDLVQASARSLDGRGRREKKRTCFHCINETGPPKRKPVDQRSASVAFQVDLGTKDGQ